MSENVSQIILTLSDVMNYMAPSAGGSVPSETDEEYSQWRQWIQVKQEEAARRGFWRRLLTRDTLSLTAGSTSILMPPRFHKPNGLYVFEVDGEDWMDPNRIEKANNIFIQMINDPDDANFSRWEAQFIEIEADATATIYYFANPPKPVEAADKLLLPGDMIAYGALSEYFRTTNLEGSQDDARNEFENRMTAYLSREVIPPRNELLNFQTNPRRIDRLHLARQMYQVRPDRLGTQS
jgi:hypothetical protein